MNNQEAAKILGLRGNINPDNIKKAYRKSATKYHPDKNSAGDEMMKLINASYEALKDFEGNIDLDEEAIKYSEKLNEALEKIIDLPNINIEVCGAWVWVTGETKPHSKTLGKKEGGAGFSYASKKKAWYRRPSDRKSKSRGSLSLNEIRNKYGSKSVDKKEKKGIAK